MRFDDKRFKEKKSIYKNINDCVIINNDMLTSEKSINQEIISLSNNLAEELTKEDEFSEEAEDSRWRFIHQCGKNVVELYGSEYLKFKNEFEKLEKNWFLYNKSVKH